MFAEQLGGSMSLKQVFISYAATMTRRRRI